jgi:NADH:ubiquinone oxidoreductase subunit E
LSRKLLRGSNEMMISIARRTEIMSMNQRLARVSEIIADHGAQPSQLIAILQDTQTAFNYLSQEDMTLIAQRLGISTAKVYSVATFYENFSLEPKGKHIIRVCDGRLPCPQVPAHL